VFDVTDDSFTVGDVKAAKAKKLRKLQEARFVANQRLLRQWQRRLKRARTEVRKRERRAKYYAGVLNAAS
jgi:hypothetical protein